MKTIKTMLTALALISSYNASAFDFTQPTHANESPTSYNHQLLDANAKLSAEIFANIQRSSTSDEEFSQMVMLYLKQLLAHSVQALPANTLNVMVSSLIEPVVNQAKQYLLDSLDIKSSPVSMTQEKTHEAPKTLIAPPAVPATLPHEEEHHDLTSHEESTTLISHEEPTDFGLHHETTDLDENHDENNHEDMLAKLHEDDIALSHDHASPEVHVQSITKPGVLTSASPAATRPLIGANPSTFAPIEVLGSKFGPGSYFLGNPKAENAADTLGKAHFSTQKFVGVQALEKDKKPTYTDEQKQALEKQYNLLLDADMSKQVELIGSIHNPSSITLSHLEQELAKLDSDKSMVVSAAQKADKARLQTRIAALKGQPTTLTLWGIDITNTSNRNIRPGLQNATPILKTSGIPQPIKPVIPPVK